MGYSLSVYAVDLEKLRGVMGSKDDAMYQQLLAKYSDDLGGDDEDDDEQGGDELDPKQRRQGGNAIADMLEMFNESIPKKARENPEQVDFGALLKQALEQKLGKALPDMELSIDDDESEDDEIPLRDALQHLIQGSKHVKHSAHQYGYALEILCRHFGKRLPGSQWEDFRSGKSEAWFQQLDEALQVVGVPEKTFRVNRHLYDRGSPIRIPKPSDYPCIGYLKLAEIKRADQALSDNNLANIPDKEVRAALEEVRGWFQECLNSDHDLICFYY